LISNKLVALVNDIIVDVCYFVNYCTHVYIANIPDINYWSDLLCFVY